MGPLTPARRLAMSRRGHLIVLVATSCLLGLWVSGSARATSTNGISAYAPAAVTIAAGSTVAVPGGQVEDTVSPGATLQVTVATTLGSLTLQPADTSSLSTAYGYSFTGPTLSFTGTAANINNALADMTLTASDTLGSAVSGTATVSIAATPYQAGVYYLPATGHYYEYVAAASVSWSTAQSDANALSFDGQRGYLASVPTATVNNFIQNDLGSGDSNVWAGGVATDYGTVSSGYRIWSWAGSTSSTATGYGGPLAGTQFTECSNYENPCAFENTDPFFEGIWNGGEPNNQNGTESYQVINYSGNGKWNDYPNNPGSVISGYIVEFGDEAPGASAWTNEASASSQLTLAAVPGAPTQVASVPGATGSNELMVSWTAPANGGSAIIGSSVTATPATGASQTCTATGTATNCTLHDLQPGVGYTIAVTAANAIGSGAAGTVSASAPAAYPTAPTGLSVSAGAVGSGQLTLSWTAPSSNGGSAISAYTAVATPVSGSGPSVTCTTGGALTCVVNQLAASSSYHIAVTATTAAGAGPAVTTTVGSPAASAPAVPAGVAATAGAVGSSQVVVSWQPPLSNGDSTITGYLVTATPQDTNGNLPSCSTSGAHACTLNNLQPGVSYTTNVVAINAIGNGPSASASVSAPISTAGAPTALTAVGGPSGSQQITVSWTAPAANGGSAITGYTVTATPASGGATPTSCTSNPSTDSCQLTGLQAGMTYSITASALNTAGPGHAASIAASAPAAQPNAPTGVTAVTGAIASNKITVSWTASSDNGGSAVTGYTVTATSPDGASQACTGSATATSCTLTDLEPGANYAITVTAANAVGASTAGTASASAPATYATAPTGLSAVAGAAGSGQLTLSWSAPSDDGGSAITSYTAVATPASGSAAATSCTSDPSTDSCQLTGLQPGMNYSIAVTALSIAGSGQAAGLAARAAAGQPTAPTGVAAAAGTPGSGQVTVSWTASSDDGGSAITGYTATAMDAGGDSQTCTGSADATSCTLTGLQSGVNYAIAVTAANTAGASVAATVSGSVPAAAATVPTVLSADPSTPTALSASAGAAGSGQITVSWSAPSSDGGSAITGYTAVATPVSGSEASATCTTNGAWHCTLNGLGANTPYQIAVTATTAAGTGPAAVLSQTSPVPAVPSAPTELVAVSATTGDAIILAWSAPLTDGSSTLTGYTVSTSSPTDATVHTCTTTTTICTITGLTPGTTYTIAVNAANAIGQGVAVSTTVKTAGASSASTAGAARVPAAAVSAGLAPTAAGAYRVRLRCPASSSGCSLDATLTAHLTAGSRHPRVLSRLTSIHIRAGRTDNLRAHLNGAVRRALQKAGVARVRVTLTVHSHLDERTSVSVTKLWMRVTAITARRSPTQS